MNDKTHKVMHEFKEGELKSGSGKKVMDRKQAVAIAMSKSGSKKRPSKHRKEMARKLSGAY